jgi:hypothetical protein
MQLFSRRLLPATGAALAVVAALTVAGSPAAHATGTPPLSLTGKTLSVWTGYSNVPTKYDYAMQSFGFRASTSAVYSCQSDPATSPENDKITEFQSSTDSNFNVNKVDAAGHCNQIGVGGANDKTVWLATSGETKITSGVFNGTQPPSTLPSQTQYDPGVLGATSYSVNVNTSSNRLVIKDPAGATGSPREMRLYSLSDIQSTSTFSPIGSVITDPILPANIHGYAVINNWVYYVTQADKDLAPIKVGCINFDDPSQTCTTVSLNVPGTGLSPQKYEVEGLSVNPAGNLVIGVNEGETPTNPSVKSFSLFKLT